MPPLDRFTVSLNTELLAAFDGFLAARGYVNRSEAIRDLIRDALLSAPDPTPSATAVSVIILTCDIKSEAAPSRIRAALLGADGLRPTLCQVPIDDTNDLWVITARGSGSDLDALTGRLRAIRGVSGVLQTTKAVRGSSEPST